MLFKFLYITFFINLSILQGVVITPLLVVITFTPVIIVSVALIPVHAFHSYMTIVVTPRLGPNLKILGLLLLPLPLLLSLLFHLVVSLLYVCLGGIVSMVSLLS